MKRLIALLPVLGLLLTPCPAEAFWPFPDPEPPVQEDIVVSTLVGEPYVFSLEDFSPDGETAEYYEIAGLPDSDIGVLQIGAMLVTQGSRVAREALSGLTWYPLDDSVREITFQVIPNTGGLAGEPAAVTIRFLTSANAAPKASDQQLHTCRTRPISGRLAAADPEGDALTFFLLSGPESGSVALDPSGRFTYTPDGKAGRFSFTWLARDCYGNRSQSATVTVLVDREEAEAACLPLSRE